MKSKILFKTHIILVLTIVSLNLICGKTEEKSSPSKVLNSTTVATPNNTTNKTQVAVVYNETTTVKIKEDAGNQTKPETVKRKKKTLRDFGNTRRKKHASTSTSSGEESGERVAGESQSLDMTSADSDMSENKRSGARSGNPDRAFPYSDDDRVGWRRWHRRCTPCIREMIRNYRDQRINWICGAYQRARRSFKSECMMYYRNCQDGTMFVKIHDHRCENNSYHGFHFFYDYRVRNSGESSDYGGSDGSLWSVEHEGRPGRPGGRPVITQFMDITLRPAQSFLQSAPPDTGYPSHFPIVPADWLSLRSQNKNKDKNKDKKAKKNAKSKHKNKS